MFRAALKSVNLAHKFYVAKLHKEPHGNVAVRLNYSF